MNHYQTIGFIGVGNMGEAFIGALIQTGLFKPSMIFANDANKSRLNQIATAYSIQAVQDNAVLFNACDIIILAVKPQQMNQVLSEIGNQKGCHLTRRKLVISIAAGYLISKIEHYLYAHLDPISQQNLPIIRVMPNTPALVLEGMSGMSPNRNARQEDIQAARSILEAIGKVLVFEEKDLDAVTGLSGSGPAYVFFLAEAMMEAGVQAGLKPDTASVLTLATLQGALALMKTQQESPEELRRKVTSPGGTTEAAFNILNQHRVKQSIIDAILAASRRAAELSRG